MGVCVYVSGQRQIHRLNKKEEGEKSKVVSAKKEMQSAPKTISLQGLFLEIFFMQVPCDEEKIWWGKVWLISMKSDN